MRDVSEVTCIQGMGIDANLNELDLRCSGSQGFIQLV